MGLFDSYFDPEQFQDSGGLLGRLLSLQPQQGQYQPAAGFSSQADSASAPAQPTATPLPVPRPAMHGLPDAGPSRTLAIGDYQMPQFGNVDPLPAGQQQPTFADRLSAGLYGLAHTPLGNPGAGLANAAAGFSAGQRTDQVGAAPSPPSQTPDLGGHLRSGFESWAHTPVGNPFAALANGLSGFGSGQRSDPEAVAQAMLRSPPTAAGQSPGPASTVAAGTHGDAARGEPRGTMPSRLNLPSPLVRSVAEGKMRKRGPLK